MAVNLLSHTKENEWERKCQYTLENIQKQMDVHLYYSVQRKNLQRLKSM